MAAPRFTRPERKPRDAHRRRSADRQTDIPVDPAAAVTDERHQRGRVGGWRSLDERSRHPGPASIRRRPSGHSDRARNPTAHRRPRSSPTAPARPSVPAGTAPSPPRRRSAPTPRRTTDRSAMCRSRRDPDNRGYRARRSARKPTGLRPRRGLRPTDRTNPPPGRRSSATCCRAVPANVICWPAEIGNAPPSPYAVRLPLRTVTVVRLPSGATSTR